MRVVLQRVRSARVEVDGAITGSIERGILVLLGVSKADREVDVHYLVEKIVNLRIFEDSDGKMNRSLRDENGALLIVSQFTLYGDCSKGRRPSFDQSAPAAEAKRLYEYFVEESRKSGVPVATGIFQATMMVHIENDGPVTLICDSPERK